MQIVYNMFFLLLFQHLGGCVKAEAKFPFSVPKKVGEKHVIPGTTYKEHFIWILKPMSLIC